LRLFLIITLITVGLYAQKRIIALSPAINEIIFALGAGERVVGNTTFCNFPKEAQSVKKVGGYFSPSLEKILALKPDIVIMQQNNFKLSLKLQKLGIKTMVTKIDKLESIRKAILKIGVYLDKEKNAKSIILDIDNRLKELKGIIKDKKILMVFGHNTNLSKQIFVAGQNLYFEDIINLSGNKNAFYSKRLGQPILNMENIIATNADIVVLVAPFTKEKGLTKKELIAPWLKLPINAAKTGAVYVVDKHYAGIASNRLVYFLRDFRSFLVDAKNRQLQ